MAKIGPVDVEIIGLTKIDKKININWMHGKAKEKPPYQAKTVRPFMEIVELLLNIKLSEW